MTLAIHQKADPNRRTPAHILDAARQVLDTIDLDPASDAEAQELVRATHWFGPNHTDGMLPGWFSSDGLVHDWCGRVWLNPPGGLVLLPGHRRKTSSAAVWWAKLEYEFMLGHVSEALFLAFTLEVFRTAQRWGRNPHKYPFCVPRERLRFESSCGRNKDAPAAASAIIYIGPNVARFRQAFDQIGACT